MHRNVKCHVLAFTRVRLCTTSIGCVGIVSCKVIPVWTRRYGDTICKRSKPPQDRRKSVWPLTLLEECTKKYASGHELPEDPAEVW